MSARSIMASTEIAPRSYKQAQTVDQENATYNKRIAHRSTWVEPSLLAEIEYRAKSAMNVYLGRVRSSLNSRHWNDGHTSQRLAPPDRAGRWSIHDVVFALLRSTRDINLMRD
jgi:hypothetical protein